MKSALTTILATSLFVVGVVSADPAPLTRPPRGWSSRGAFDCTFDCSRGMDTCLSEILMQNMTDVLAQPEFAKAGYDWLLLGECWTDNVRDPYGHLLANETRFPGGIKAVADYAHSKGLRLAVYINIVRSPLNMPGLHGHVEDDVRTLTSWGVDMIYVDTQLGTYPQVSDDFHELGKAIRRSGSGLKVACTWPEFLVQHGMRPDYDEIKQVCDVYRSTERLTSSSGWSDVLQVAEYYAKDMNNVTEAAGSSNKWNDIGMLLLGQGGMPLNQWLAQMAMWVMYDSSMFVSCDLPNMPEEVKRAMLLQGVLDVDGDTWDQRPVVLVQKEHIHIVHRFATSGDLVVLLLNTSPTTTLAFTDTLFNLGLTVYPIYRVVDVLNDVRYGQVDVRDAMNVSLAPLSAVLLRCYAEH